MMETALHPDLVVNGETIPHAMVAAETQHHDVPKGKPGLAWRKAANAVALRTLLLQEARRRDIRIDPAQVGPGRFETDEEALIRGLLERSISVDTPTDAAIRTEWSRDPDRFRSPPLWEVSHILFACDPRDENAKLNALARAESVVASASVSAKEFARIAAEYSDCGSKSSGGALGQLGPGDTAPEFEAVLRSLSEGQITPQPVLTRHGWHIIRMDVVAKGRVLPFEAVEQHISDALEKVAWAKAAREFVDALVASADIAGAELKTEQKDVKRS